MTSRDVTVNLTVALTNGADFQDDEVWTAVAHAIEDELTDFAYRNAGTGLAFESASVNVNVEPKQVDFGEFDAYGPYDYGDIR